MMAPMADMVPRLDPRPTSLVMRAVSLVVPGVRQIVGQIDPYTRWWDDQNQRAAAASGPLLVSVGDSTTVGIGASGPDRSYVALLRDVLTAGDGRPWRMVNLGLSGARVADALERQLPALEGLRPEVVVCCIGTNDIVWGRETARLRAQIRQLVERLPDGTVVGSLAGGSARARLANRALRAATRERGLTLVDPWAEPTPPGRERLAVDRFHPNDLGYELMTVPFARALGLPVGWPLPLPDHGADGATLPHDGTAGG